MNTTFNKNIVTHNPNPSFNSSFSLQQLHTFGACRQDLSSIASLTFCLSRQCSIISFVSICPTPFFSKESQVSLSNSETVLQTIQMYLFQKCFLYALFSSHHYILHNQKEDYHKSVNFQQHDHRT